MQFGEYDRALDALKRAIDLNGSDPEAYRGLAAVLLWRGDTQGAIAAGGALGRFQPDLSAPDTFHLAMAYVLADRDADAIRILRQSLDRDSTDPNTNIMLAAAYAQAGNKPGRSGSPKASAIGFRCFRAKGLGRCCVRRANARSEGRVVARSVGHSRSRSSCQFCVASMMLARCSAKGVN